MDGLKVLHQYGDGLNYHLSQKLAKNRQTHDLIMARCFQGSSLAKKRRIFVDSDTKTQTGVYYISFFYRILLLYTIGLLKYI